MAELLLPLLHFPLRFLKLLLGNSQLFLHVFPAHILLLRFFYDGRSEAGNLLSSPVDSLFCLGREIVKIETILQQNAGILLLG